MNSQANTYLIPEGRIYAATSSFNSHPQQPDSQNYLNNSAQFTFNSPGQSTINPAVLSIPPSMPPLASNSNTPASAPSPSVSNALHPHSIHADPAPNKRRRLTEQERKENHAASENNRRNNIQVQFDRIAAAVPGMQDMAKKHGPLLQGFLAYIEAQIAERRRLIAEIEARGGVVADEDRLPADLLNEEDGEEDGEGVEDDE